MGLFSKDNPIGMNASAGEETLLRGMLTNPMWIPVILLFTPFFVLCFNVCYTFVRKNSQRNSLEMELNRRKQLTAEYEKMSLRGIHISYLPTVYMRISCMYLSTYSSIIIHVFPFLFFFLCLYLCFYLYLCLCLCLCILSFMI